MIHGLASGHVRRPCDQRTYALDCLMQCGPRHQVDVTTRPGAAPRTTDNDSVPTIFSRAFGAHHSCNAEANTALGSVLYLARFDCHLDEAGSLGAARAWFPSEVAKGAVSAFAPRSNHIQGNCKSISTTGPTHGPICPFLVGPVLTSLQVAAGCPDARLAPALRAALARYPTRDCRRDPCNVSLRCFAPARWR